MNFMKINIKFSLILLTCLWVGFNGIAKAQTVFEINDADVADSYPKLVYITQAADGTEKVIVPESQDDAFQDFMQSLKTSFTVSGGVNTLQGAFGSFGIIVGQQADTGGKYTPNVSAVTGMLIKLQVSQSGGMASMGFMNRDEFPFFAFAGTVDFYRSWADRSDSILNSTVMAGQSFLGASFNAKFLILDFTVGVLRHVGGTQSDLGWIPHVGVGLGL